MKRILTLVLCVCAVFCMTTLARAEALSGEVIRLHVVADSGSAEDLAAKNAVRDAILEAYFGGGQEDLSAAREYIMQNLDGIRALAEKTLRELDKSVPVSVHFGLRRLPEKDYGSFSLPAGRYETLTVTLGAGEGSNWWCVLYPPLCVVPAAALRETAEEAGISEQGIAMMTGRGEEIRLRFKLLEIFSEMDMALFGR